MTIANVDTIVIVILENRSFDHMVGYLSLPGQNGPPELEGLSDAPEWTRRYANEFSGSKYQPHLVNPGAGAVDDPPHAQASISVQINTLPVGPGPTKMGGFVQSYHDFSKSPPHQLDAVMGHHGPQTVPAFDFFARHYCICDHWFSALPLGTQANRLMAMSGESRLIDNSGLFLPDQPLVYDWPTEKGVPWCAYQWGNFLPFFI